MTDPAVQAFVREALANEMLRDLEAAGVVQPGPGFTIEEITRRHIETRAAGIAGLRQVDELLGDVVARAERNMGDLRAHVEVLRHCLRESGEFSLRSTLLSDGERGFLRPREMRDVPSSLPTEPDGGAS